MTIKIKSGAELSGLTSATRAKYLSCREFYRPEPKWLSHIYFAVAFMALGAAIAFVVCWYAIPEGRF